MSTGYTNKISEGCTFEEFVWSCARAMGANVMMRDDPMNAKIRKYKVSSYHLKELKKAKQKLTKLHTMSLDQIEKCCEKHNRTLIAIDKRRKTTVKSLHTKYEAMLEKVTKWNPPSPDHKPFKDFMISQIEDSIKFDCSIDTDDDTEPDQKLTLTPREWIARQIESAQWDIDYHTKEYAKECERTNGRNKWNSQLAKSVPQPK